MPLAFFVSSVFPTVKTLRHVGKDPQSVFRKPLVASSAIPLSTPTPTRPKRTLSHGLVLEQCADALEALTTASSTAPRLTLDFPPERSEERSGTLVARYENNLNFLEKLIAALGTNPDACTRIGPPVEIRDNVNPQGGGEYLTDDEVMVGLRAPDCPRLQGRSLLGLINAGVDATTLKQVRNLDINEEEVVILLNCGLERLSWFAKLGMDKYFDRFEPAYYLKNIGGNGWLLKKSPAPWQVFVRTADGADLVQEEEKRPTIVDVEAILRLAIAGIRPETK